MAKGKLVAEKKSSDTEGESLEELFFRITESGEEK